MFCRSILVYKSKILLLFKGFENKLIESTFMKNEALIEQIKQKIMKNPYNAQNHYEMAALLEETDLSLASEEYELAVKYDPKFVQAKFNLGMTYTLIKKYADAVSVWQKITDADNNIRTDKINYNLKTGAIQKCMSAWEIFLSAEKSSQINYFNAGIAFAFLGDLQKAKNVFLKLLEINQNFDAANYYTGLVFSKLGESDKAIFYFSEELKLKPAYLPAMCSIGEILYKQNKISKALKQFEEITKIKPNHISANYHMAVIKSLNRHFEEALLILEKIISSDPNSVEAHLECAKIFEKTFKIDKAIEKYELILKIDPDNKYANLHLARAHKKLGKADLALNYFQKALQIDPGDDEVHYYTAEVLSQMGRYEDAEKEYKMVLTLVPKHGYAHYSLGQTYLKLNKLNEAAESFKRALEINPKDAQARNLLGVTYFKLGNLSHAVEEFEIALRQNPQDVYAHYYLGAIYFRLQNFEAAIKEYQKISELNPESAYAHFALGATLSRSEDFENAISQFQKAADLILSPEVDMALFATLQLLAVIGVEHAKQGQKVGQLYNELEESYKNTVRSLAKAVDARDRYTQFHSDRVAKIAGYLAKELGLSYEEISRIEIAGYLHDIGKIGIKDEILLKPGKLTNEEQEIMRTHPMRGAEILKEVKLLWDIMPLVKCHHEKIDGTGYPEALKNDAIPLGAKIIGISDFYDALTTDRPYRKAIIPEKVIEEIKKIKGIKFDDFIIDAFLKIFDKLPAFLEGLKPVV